MAASHSPKARASAVPKVAQPDLEDKLEMLLAEEINLLEKILAIHLVAVNKNLINPSEEGRVLAVVVKALEDLSLKLKETHNSEVELHSVLKVNNKVSDKHLAALAMVSALEEEQEEEEANEAEEIHSVEEDHLAVAMEEAEVTVKCKEVALMDLAEEVLHLVEVMGKELEEALTVLVEEAALHLAEVMAKDIEEV